MVGRQYRCRIQQTFLRHSRDEGGPGVAAVREYLTARGVALGWVSEVEPTVEDVFVSFVDRERKSRVREQLRALGAAER